MSKKIYILNALSLNLVEGSKVEFHLKKSNQFEARCLCSGADVVSAVRHGLEFLVKEIAKECHTFTEVFQVSFGPGTHNVLVLQYRGPRLPEGARELPPDATLEWWEGVVVVWS